MSEQTSLHERRFHIRTLTRTKDLLLRFRAYSLDSRGDADQETIIPTAPHDWVTNARVFHPISDLQKGLQACKYQDWNSASKMQYERFLLLRAYWTERDASEFSLRDLVGKEQQMDAEKVIEAETTFVDYLQTLEDRLQSSQMLKQKRSVSYDDSKFAMVLSQQDDIWNLPEVSDSEGEPKIKMTPQPRYMTRPKSARHATQESPTPKPSNADSSVLGVTSVMRDLSLRGNITSTPPKPGGVSYSEHATSKETPTFNVESIKTSESQISPFSPFSPRQIKPTTGQQTVHMALVLFLRALTRHRTETVRWAADHNVFRMGVLYEARIDGCLLLNSRRIPLAILETKAHVRKANSVQIMMQETAQVAAWIKTHPEDGVIPSDSKASSHRRLLISQDNREIYIIIAEYDDAYQDYLTHTCIDSRENQPKRSSPTRLAHQFDFSESGPFLHMRSYGPFDTKTAKHMKSFATAVVAFTTILEKNGRQTRSESQVIHK